MITLPELLSPAGDLEKLQVAIAYGADAVYLSGTSFGLRAKAKNFSSDQLAYAISYAHQKNVKAYITANIFAHNADISQMTGYFASLAEMGADAFIISDPGVMQLAKKEAPGVEIHISTQANVTNYASAQFWQDMGASRIVLARELSLQEIAEIKAKTTIPLEGFVHGAMCMSYSGRCMLSRYMTGRDANLGACAHPCRYQYRLYAEDQTRPGSFMPVLEDEHGADIFGAEDLCMVQHIPDLINAGLDSFKIEGRMKTSFYVALATRTYRQAIDNFTSNTGQVVSDTNHLDMLKMASHRPFSTGFYFGKPNTDFTDSAYMRTHDFVGIVKEYNYDNKSVIIEQRNAFSENDLLTFIQPSGNDFTIPAANMLNEKGIKISRAPHAKQTVVMEVLQPVEEMTVICRKI